MSSQYPGAGSEPAPAPAPGPGGATTPAPVTAPYAPGNFDGVQPAADATAGWAAPQGPAGPAAPAWGMPRQESPAPAAAAGWGAPGATSRSAAKPWTLKRGLAVAGAAAVLAVGTGAGVYALTSSSASADGTAAGTAGGLNAGGTGGQGFAPGAPGSAQDGTAGGGMAGQGGPGDFAAGGMGSGLSAAVHAEYVVLQGTEYTTMAQQTGTVSEVSASSVTVKSTDGFTRSYALGSDVAVSNLQQRRQQADTSGTQLSVADIVAGGTVRVVAAKEGSGFTASSVMVVAATATGQTN